jgi:hypothetical protein
MAPRSPGWALEARGLCDDSSGLQLAQPHEHCEHPGLLSERVWQVHENVSIRLHQGCAAVAACSAFTRPQRHMPDAVRNDLKEPLIQRDGWNIRVPLFRSSASMEASSVPTDRRRLSLAQLIRRSNMSHANDDKVVNPLRSDSMSSVSSESGGSTGKLYRSSTVRVKKSDHTIHQAAASKVCRLWHALLLQQWSHLTWFPCPCSWQC